MSESISDLYAPFARAVDALRGVSVDALARAGRRVEVAAPDEPLQTAASRMGWRKVGALAVERDGRLIGALSEDDLLRVTALRIAELAPLVEDQGDDLGLWDRLLAKLTVADVMTARHELALARPGASMIEGISAICTPTAHDTRFRYLWVLDPDERLVHVVSIRDVARGLIRLYDRDFPPEAFADPAGFEEAHLALTAVLDLSIGGLRERLAVGHAPSVIHLGASGAETVSRMWGDRRGYVLTILRDGAPLGICTRRDLVRGLRDPFADLGRLRVSRLMTGPVMRVTDTNTMSGLFKLMAIEGFRHMPLVDASDRVVRMISMWEAVSFFAPRRRPSS
jgi:CBS domain-containing protein